MIRRNRRSLPLAAALSVVAGFVALAGAITGNPETLTLSCPSSVYAGMPINGYATGGISPRTVTADGMDGPLPGSPATGPEDPLYFSFPTLEHMSGSTVFVTATESGPQIVTKGVAVK